MSEQGQITIHNKISQNYKEIHVDGAFGGITPRGLINLSFFAERAPIPKSSEFVLNDGRVGDFIENSIDSKKGILREFEVGIYMSLEVVKSLIEMLGKQASELEAILKANQNDTTKHE
ncbi:MAG: hypothetical protein ABIY90_04955 [Puia sp.]